jgi:Domain of unknown function (DUF4265)
MREEPGTLIVSGRARYPSRGSRETMHALPDPADPDQAVIVNVPFFVNGLNFGDVVRLGRSDDIGIRAIEEIVIPSGHTRFLALTGFLSAPDLVDRLHHAFPSYALRIEGDGDGLLSVSVHPDLVPDDVVYEVFDWFEEEGVPPGDESVGVTSLFESEVGPLP